MPKIVLDTNILLRAIARRSGPSGRLWARRHEFTLCSSNDTIAEFFAVAARASVRAKVAALTDATVEEMVAELQGGLCVDSVPEVKACRDPHDDKFIACALAAGAQYVVAEDKDLLELDGYEGLRCVSPAEFAQLLEGEDSHV